MDAPIIKALLVDLSGVLFEDGTKIAIEKLSAEGVASPDVILETLWGKLSWDLRCGKLEADEFWRITTDTVFNGDSQATATIRKTWLNCFSLREDVAAFLREISKSVTIAAISGTTKERILYLDEKFSFRDIFDFETYSFACGFTKIDKRIYEKAVEELKRRGISPDQSLFIDDNADCLETAEIYGIHTQLYDGVEALVEKYPSLKQREVIPHG